VCVKVQPLSQKFADSFTHRDFLGALMSLGIRREVVGDIIISDNCGYILCLESIADYIAASLEQVRRTSVKCSVEQSVPENAAPVPKAARLIIASERIDAIVSAVYKLSRSESQRLFEQEKIFINGKAAPRLSALPEMGDIISVRGHGRFIYDGIEKQTKKGRICVNVEIYQ
jgi:RNA-binding protein YlmH